MNQSNSIGTNHPCVSFAQKCSLFNIPTGSSALNMNQSNLRRSIRPCVSRIGLHKSTGTSSSMLHRNISECTILLFTDLCILALYFAPCFSLNPWTNTKLLGWISCYWCQVFKWAFGLISKWKKMFCLISKRKLDNEKLFAGNYSILQMGYNFIRMCALFYVERSLF